MEDKKQSVAILIIILIVITYFQYVSNQDHKRRQLSKQKAVQTASQNSSSEGALLQAGTTPPTQINSTPQAVSSNNPASLEQLHNSEKISFDNGSLLITFNLLGARMQTLELTDSFKELSHSSLYNLVNLEDQVALPAGIRFGGGSDDQLIYSLESSEGISKDEKGIFTASAEQSKLTFSATLKNNLKIVKTYSFQKNSHLFKVNAAVIGAENMPGKIEITWPIHIKKAELEHRYDPYFFSVMHTDKKVSHTQALSKLEDLKKNQPANWLSFGDRYFMTAVVPQDSESSIRVDTANELFTLVDSRTGNQAEVAIYAGPKNYENLKTYGLSLERSVDLGFVSFIAYPLLQLLRMLYSLFGNYGVAIVALTLLVKNALYPLNKASLKSMKGMQELAPEMQALKERIKDPTQLNKEIFALYKRKGVNPMGGCLPIAIQIPIFFGLYSALQNAVELRHAPFALWVKDLATPEKLNLFGINFPVIVLAMGAIMFIQQYRTPMPNVDPAQRKMVLSMSVIFTLMFLIFPFPAGLAIYMFINTLISLIQQQSLRSERINSPFVVTIFSSFVILAISIALTKL